LFWIGLILMLFFVRYFRIHGEDGDKLGATVLESSSTIPVGGL